MVQQTREMIRRESASECGIRARRVMRHRESGAGFHQFGDTPQKQAQRNEAEQHLSRLLHIIPGHKQRLLSLPGEHWIVENMLADRFKQMRMVGFESNSVVFEKSIAWMPRGRTYGNIARPMRMQYPTPMGMVDTVDSIRSRLFNADLRLCFYKREMKDPTGLHKRSWISSPFSAFWLDSFSPLGSELGFKLCRLIAVKSPKLGSTFAIAFTIGRDDPLLSGVIDAAPGSTPLERRTATVKQLIERHGRAVVIDNAMQHDSWNENGNVKIGTVFGRVLPMATGEVK